MDLEAFRMQALDQGIGIAEVEMSDSARDVFLSRYATSKDGARESVEEVILRVAAHVASHDPEVDSIGMTRLTAEFYNLIGNWEFLPNSPTFTGADTELNQLAACFLLPISDDMGRADDGIFSTLRDMALIQQTGGGTGFSLSDIRPRGDRVASSGGKATGPVGFLRVYDKASGIISQGGVRRGANMAVLDVTHPDVMDFISAKTEEGSIENFNLSVGVTDEFMDAYRADADVELINPRNGEVWESISSSRIFDSIVENAFRNGEPGILFLDRLEEDNPTPYIGRIRATNPCGEQPLLPYESCCLGAINLSKHFDSGFMLWGKLADTARLATRFLDDVIEANGFVPDVPLLREMALKTRKIGVGITGLADVLYKAGISYNSKLGWSFASGILEFIRFHVMSESIELARDRGPFHAIEGSVYDPNNVTWEPPAPLSTPGKEHVGRQRCPDVNWSRVVDGIERHGIRNAAQMTVAPTGTRSTIAGCEGYGCEPVFALSYTRKIKDDGSNTSKEIEYVSPLFERKIRSEFNDERKVQLVMEQVLETGSCQDIETVPQNIKDVFVVSQDIPPRGHILMQAHLQAFVDASISKTVNLPPGSTRDDVRDAFLLAWESGCKGVTVYVSGSRKKAVLETKSEGKPGGNPGSHKDEVAPHGIRPRPKVLPGKTYKFRTPAGTAYMTINLNGDGKPFEVFLSVGKAGSDIAAMSEALGRLMSLTLRIASPTPPDERLAQIAEQMRGIGGRRPIGFGGNRVRSLPDGIAKIIGESANDEGEGEGNVPSDCEGKGSSMVDLCPECGAVSLRYEEGCRHCSICGFSEC